MSTHAFLSPSFGHIGYKCPASALRSFQVKQRMQLLTEVGADLYGLKDKPSIDRLKLVLTEDNSMAKEGTALHEIFEQAMLKRITVKSKILKLIKDHTDISKSTKQDDYICNSFYSCVIEQLKFIKDAEWVGVEHRIKIKGLPQYGTVDLVIIKNGELYIRDLKTGYNEVSSENNHQLMTYAVGILDELGWGKFTRVHIGVIGVRWHSDEWTTSIGNLGMFKYDVMLPGFMKAYSINPEAIPGDHCLYCVGKIHCKQWQEKFKGMINETYTDEFIEDHDNDGLVEMYKLCKQSANLVKYQLSPELLQRFESFDMPKNITKVSGRKIQKWNVTDDEVEIALEKSIDNIDDIFSVNIKTPVQIKKLLKDEEVLQGITNVVTSRPYLKV